MAQISGKLAVNVTVEQFLHEAKAIGVQVDEVLKSSGFVFLTATPAQVKQLQSSPVIAELYIPIPASSKKELTTV
jgi:hypothetical protein